MTPDNKTVSVYIPDELRKRAEEAGINLSATLRDALEEELGRRDAIANALSGGVEEHEVEMEDYTGVITGKHIGTLDGDDEVYLTDDERVLAYDPAHQRIYEFTDPETELADLLEGGPGVDAKVDPAAVADIMRALGYRPRVRL